MVNIDYSEATEYYKGEFCVVAKWLFGEGQVMPKSCYDQLVARKHIRVARRGCCGNSALVAYDSIPDRFKKVIEELHEDLRARTAKSYLEQMIMESAEAREYFVSCNGGKLMSNDKWKVPYTNAIVLDAVLRVRSDRRGLTKVCKGSKKHIWGSLLNEVVGLDKAKYPHTLPLAERRFKEKVGIYESEGYSCLINGNFGNNNARKVSVKMERLILSIYCMTNKPYASWVYEDYMAFVAGRLDIVDMTTGEFVDREEFWDEKRGQYVSISESTCWNYINNPKNRAIVDSIRSTGHAFSHKVRPHTHRHNAVYSMSKISLDDRDLPRRMLNGDRVKAYYAYDVASGCLIGVAYSVRKDAELFVNCIRDMFRFIDQRGWGVPMEMEVEHHLVRLFEDDLMKAGTVFPMVRWCAAGNSQEKHAEQFNRQKKYGYEKRYQDGIGRWYAKSEANQTGGERVFNDETQHYEIKERKYTKEQLIADDMATIEAYNNGLHRDQKTYKGKTRMEVLVENLNPNLLPINRALLIKYIGEMTSTSVVRNHYVNVQHNKYMLPTPEVLGRLLPNNYTVQAYYMPEDEISEVYLYQNDIFITRCEKLKTFTTATAEWKPCDTVARASQQQYIDDFDAMVAAGREDMMSARLMQGLESIGTVEVKVVDSVEEEDDEMDDYYSLAIDYTEKARVDYY